MLSSRKKYGLLSKYLLAKHIDKTLNNEVISELQSKGIQITIENPSSDFEKKLLCPENLYSVKLNEMKLFHNKHKTTEYLKLQPYVSWEIWNWLYLEVNEVVQTKQKQKLDQHKKREATPKAAT